MSPSLTPRSARSVLRFAPAPRREAVCPPGFTVPREILILLRARRAPPG